MELGPLQTKWIESLETHPERQRTDLLGKRDPDGSYKACCLGEGGLIAGVCEWSDSGYLQTIVGKNTSSLSDLTFKALGLRGPFGEAASEDGAEKLANLNDCGTTWSEIAKKLRANPEKYFTEPK